MNSIKFRIAAKTDVGLVRTNNEDNFQASADLLSGQMRWINNEICSLGDKGALLVVADGMGGMNAGEVASELAINTIREWFSPERLTPEVLKNRFSIEKHMNDAIVAADSRIKAEAKARPETRGMGTTIVIGWIIDGKLYLSWCGDSRAYIYNPTAGLHQISKDHSYVQSLVDKGSLTREEAFDFPDSNIITRCLSDGSSKAKPESLLRPYEICNNDIILLCTDGLSGMIRDTEMESIIRANEHNMDTLVDELIGAACAAEGSDNITICLCQILQGAGECNPAVFTDYDKRLNGGNDNFIKTLISNPDNIRNKKSIVWIIIFSCIILALVCGALWWFIFNDKPEPVNDEEQAQQVIEQQDKTSDATNDKTTDGSNPEETKDNGASTTSAGKKKNEDNAKANSGGTIFNIHNNDTNADAGDNQDEDSDELTPIENHSNTAPDEKPEANEIPTETYTVQSGDNYTLLAKKFSTTVDILMKLNGNAELKAGAIINIPK